METVKQDQSITRDVVTLAGAIIVIIGMKLLASVIVPVLTAMLLFVVLLPLLRWFERKGISAVWARVLIIVTTLAGMLLVQALIIISIAQITEDLPAQRVGLQQRFDEIASKLSDVGIDVSGEELGAQFDLGRLVSQVIEFLPSVTSAIAGSLMALFIFIYAIIDADGISRRLKLGIGGDGAQLSNVALTLTTVSDYIRIRAVLGGLAAGLELVLLLFVGVDYALLWGLVAFFMSFIPFVGYWIALIPPFLLALIESGWSAALLVFFGYWLINGAIDNLVGPRMLGQGLNIAPAVTIISISFWGLILGPTGAILAMPLTVGFKLLLLERSPNSRWLALLVSARDDDDAEPEATPVTVPGVVGIQPG